MRAQTLRKHTSQLGTAVLLSPLDACRGPEEADAESVRTAVLLDELDFPGEPAVS